MPRFALSLSAANVTHVDRTQPLVRSITCWTLGRYASWIAQVTSEEHRATYFVPTMEGVCLVTFHYDQLGD